MKKRKMIQAMVDRYNVVKQDLKECGTSWQDEVVEFYIMARVLDKQLEMGMMPPEIKVKTMDTPDGAITYYAYEWEDDNEA